MFEEAISLISIWASMNSWLTPTVLFLLLNLMIGTIAVTSGFTSYKPPPPPPHHHHHPDHHHHHIHHHHHQQPQLMQTHLTRAPSVIQRLKSFNFYSYIHSPYQQQQQPIIFQQPPPPASPVVPEQVLEPLTHFPLSATTVENESAEPTHLSYENVNPPMPTASHHEVSTNNSSNSNNKVTETETEIHDDDEGPTLDEVYSFIKGTSTPNYNRQNSDTKPAGGEVPVPLPRKMKKSASDKSAFNHFQERDITTATAIPPILPVAKIRDSAPPLPPPPPPVVGGGGGGEDGGVDARADDFINKFRQQLQMQRLDSIVRYKDMITRGTAK